MNAYNFWHLFYHGDLMIVNDWFYVYDTTARIWGIRLFFTSSFFALLPILIVLTKQFLIFVPTIKLKKETILLAAMMMPLLFFFFNTQMHERYAFPFLLFAAAYSFLTGRYFLLIFGSFTNFFQLEGVLHFMNLDNYKIAVFHPAFVASMFIVLIIYGYFQLYISVFGKRQFKI